ncbi:hypothetical protein K431DRAFT_281008 [Polychaeton citri CBS 116435]|uniref:Uncharacterized protein n=1 Tax=Polychaeton citri CBS 116435 TaxID=1314669 RepID=A0A9P4QJ12_9PEZI|nr:hypothetical protein K431DRAFT_281008 [Polychaeton citri CBS 116435]
MRFATILAPLLATGASAFVANGTYPAPSGTVFTILPTGTGYPYPTGTFAPSGTVPGPLYPSSTAPIDNGAASFTYAGSALAAAAVGAVALVAL